MANTENLSNESYKYLTEKLGRPPTESEISEIKNNTSTAFKTYLKNLKNQQGEKSNDL